MIVQNGSGFDSYIVLNILPQWRSVVNLIKNVGGIVSFRIFYRYVDEKKKYLIMFSLDVANYILGVVQEKQVTFLSYDLRY